MTSPQNQAEQLSGSSGEAYGLTTTSTQRDRAPLRGATSELMVAPQQGSGDESECKARSLSP